MRRRAAGDPARGRGRGGVKRAAAAQGAVVCTLALAAVALAGCTAAGSAQAGPATSVSVSPPSSAPASASAISLPSTAPTTSSAPAQATTPAAPPTTPKPSISDCPVTEKALIHIDSVGVDSATGLNSITAEPAERLCGPGVEDDYEFQTTGAAAKYLVSTQVKINVLNNQNQLVPITWAQFKASDIGIYGGYYGVDEGNTGLITVIDMYFHP